MLTRTATHHNQSPKEVMSFCTAEIRSNILKEIYDKNDIMYHTHNIKLTYYSNKSISEIRISDRC